MCRTSSLALVLSAHTVLQKSRLHHLVDELAHVLLPVSGVTTLDVADEFSGPPSAVRVGELEGPEGGRGLLEVGAAGGDLVDEVLNAWGSGRYFGFEWTWGTHR